MGDEKNGNKNSCCFRCWSSKVHTIIWGGLDKKVKLGVIGQGNVQTFTKGMFDQ